MPSYLSSNWNGVGYGPFQIRLQIELKSQNVAGNYSTIARSVQLVRTNGPNGQTWTGSPNGTWSSMVGPTVTNSGGLTYDFRTVGEKVLLDYAETTYSHNTDGTLSLPYSASFSNTHIGAASLSGTYVVPTIPRASNPSFNPGSVLTTGTVVEIRTHRASASHTHDITWHFGGASGEVVSNLETDHNWTPPHEMFNTVPNASSGSGYIRTVTKNGSTVVGTKDTAFTLTLADIPDNLPTLAVTATDPVTTPVNIATVVAAFVQGQSKVRGTFTSSAGAVGSTVTARSFTVAGQTVDLTLPATQGDTPNVLNISGASTPVVFTVTDSRGRSRSTTININVVARSQPQIISASVARSTGTTLNPSGVDLRVTVNASISSLMVTTQKNLLYVRVYSSPKGANTWTLRSTVVNGTTATSYNSTSTVTMSGGFLITNSYDIRVEVADRWSPATNHILTVSTAAVFMFWGSSTVGIGKFPENGQLDVAGAIYGGSVFANGIDVRRVATATLNGVVELATNAETQTGTDSTRAVTPAGLASRTATESRTGVAEIATQAEVNTGTDHTRMVTPMSLRNSTNIPWAMSVGRAPHTMDIAPATGVTLNVTLPSGRFTQAPMITATPRSSSRLQCAILNTETTTSFSVRLDNFTAANANPDGVNWQAVQMASGSASG